MEPDVAYATATGGRVEVFSSVGDNDGTVDWRQVNEFAYLISSVPKYSHIYATIFNSYYDHYDAKYNSTTDKYSVYDSDGNLATKMFSPTHAFRDQLNQYTKAERSKYIQTLGSRDTIEAALAAGSSLADLMTTAGLLKLCDKGIGACLFEMSGGIMHSKYALLEKARDSEGKLWDNVVWITSSNLNGASGSKKSNLGIAFFGGASDGAYSGLVNKVWNNEWNQWDWTVAKDLANLDPYTQASNSGVLDASKELSYYPSPRRRDFEAEFLASQTNAKVGTKTLCTSYTVQSLFSEFRDELAAGLGVLTDEGCDVRVILGTNALSDVASTYFKMSATLRKLVSRVVFANVHDKSMTLTYTANGRAVGYAWTGSANYNGTSMKYDELAVKIANLTAARAVELHDDRMYELAKAGSSVIPVTSVTVAQPTGPLAAGSTLKLTATVAPSSATVKTLNWKSSDPLVATVATDGTVTAIKQGTATITVTAVSGNKSATASVVVGAGTGTPSIAPPTETTTPTTTPTDTPVVTPPASETPAVTPPASETPPAPAISTITSAPVLSMPVNPKVGATSVATVTWAQGATKISGTVSLQYYSAGVWKNYKTITVTNGAGSSSQVFLVSHSWRAKAVTVTTPAKATIASAAAYSSYEQMVIASSAAGSTPKLYGPSILVAGDSAPFLAQWKYSTGPNTLKLQFDSAGKWVTKTTVTIPKGATSQLISFDVVNTRKWRIVSSTGKASASITVKTA
ncbi:MAG: Ig-like domain-containing protein [Propionicimonas sp.]